MDRAKHIFGRIQHPDVKTYTAMSKGNNACQFGSFDFDFFLLVNGYALNGMGTQAIELYRQMPRESMNEFTHVCVLNACSHSGLVEEARWIFHQIEKKTDKIYTTMVIGVN